MSGPGGGGISGGGMGLISGGGLSIGSGGLGIFVGDAGRSMSNPNATISPAAINS
jgi:hypothetical protein